MQSLIFKWLCEVATLTICKYLYIFRSCTYGVFAHILFQKFPPIEEFPACLLQLSNLGDIDYH